MCLFPHTLTEPVAWSPKSKSRSLTEIPLCVCVKVNTSLIRIEKRENRIFLIHTLKEVILFYESMIASTGGLVSFACRIGLRETEGSISAKVPKNASPREFGCWDSRITCAT